MRHRTIFVLLFLMILMLVGCDSYTAYYGDLQGNGISICSIGGKQFALSSHVKFFTSGSNRDLVDFIHDLYGAEYTIADWNEIKSLSSTQVNSLCDALGIAVETPYMISRNGTRYQSGNSHYYLLRQNIAQPQVEDEYDEIGNEEYLLYSGIGAYPVLAIKNGSSNLEIPPTSTTGTVSGRVIDTTTGNGLASVIVQSGAISTITDSNGDFTLTLEEGSRILEFSRTGYTIPNAIVLIVGGTNITVSSSSILATPTSTTGTVSGRVIDATTGNGLASVAVQSGAVSTITDSNGDFTLTLEEGSRILEFSRTGYTIPNAIVLIVGGTNITVSSSSILATPTSTTGTVSGRVIDTTTGNGLASVIVQSGAVSTVTDSDGDFSLTLEEGSRTLEFSRSGFTIPNTTITVAAGSNTELPTSSILANPSMVSGSMRAILSWNENPRDLDLHLLTPEGQHVYFDQKEPSGAGAKLDVDDTSSYGPETITITTMQTGTYRIYVHLYEGSGSLGTSGATLSLHNETGLIRTFEVPASGNDRYWYVCDVVNGTIVSRNQIVNSIEFPNYFEYEVGDIGPAGGYIFYVDDENVFDWTYLEAAPAMYEFSDKVWGKSGISLPTGTSIGTGESNTVLLASVLAPHELNNDFAAKVCADLVMSKNGVMYDDWFLPSKDELYLMHTNLYLQGVGDFSDDRYWSSSEDLAYYAFSHSFSIGYQERTGRRNVCRVRPVRAF